MFTYVHTHTQKQHTHHELYFLKLGEKYHIQNKRIYHIWGGAQRGSYENEMTLI